MPKLTNVTADDIKAAVEAAEDASAAVFRITSRIQQGYCNDDIPSPLQSAGSLLSASGMLAELARALIIRAAMVEQKVELETMLRAQQGKGAVSK